MSGKSHNPESAAKATTADLPANSDIPRAKNRFQATHSLDDASLPTSRSSSPPLGLTTLDRVGNTPLLRFDRIVRDLTGIEMLGKAEWFNPGGSVKDRAAARIISEGRRSGKFAP